MKNKKYKNIKKQLNLNKGITLIALVVTIIVLLIFVGISISMISGQNGILSRAAEAKKETEKAQEEESLKLAYTTAVTESDPSASINDENGILDNFCDELDNLGKIDWSRTEEIYEDGKTTALKIAFNETTDWYQVSLENGTIEKKGNLDDDINKEKELIISAYKAVKDDEELTAEKIKNKLIDLGANVNRGCWTDSYGYIYIYFDNLDLFSLDTNGTVSYVKSGLIE